MINVLWNILLAIFIIALILITAVGTVLLLYTIIALLIEMVRENRKEKHGQNGNCD